MRAPCCFLLVGGQCGLPTAAGSWGLPTDQWETMSGNVYHSEQKSAVMAITSRFAGANLTDHLLPASEDGGWLLQNPVAIEKLQFGQNSRNLGDRKCLPKRRSSFVGLPIAKFFRRFSGEGVFQQPLPITLIIGLALTTSCPSGLVTCTHPQRASSVVPFCEEGAFEVLAVQIDFVLRCALGACLARQ